MEICPLMKMANKESAPCIEEHCTFWLTEDSDEAGGVGCAVSMIFAQLVSVNNKLLAIVKHLEQQN
jgi:hypothetical protein